MLCDTEKPLPSWASNPGTRRALLANLVCSLITHNRIRTTVAKAKEARRYADKMVTLAKKGTLHHRRQALAFLRQQDIVKKLFTEIGKANAERVGGYTRVIRADTRHGDAAEMAILEWTSIAPAAPEPEKPEAAKETKPTDEAPKAKPAKKPTKKIKAAEDAAAK